jgi:tetratricopeptide (TPR) repeat protein
VKKSVLIPVIIILYLSFFVQDIRASAGNSDPLAGTITDTVRCKMNPKFSYAIYLPKSFTRSAKWPLICLFDPGARARLAIAGFCQAAEKSGYILICSNQSRNGMSWKEYLEIADYLLTDVEANYSIDHKRIYTSGFSGGSRAAAFIAMHNKFISGVIACGAGFPETADIINIPHFDYYGLVGNKDMNYLEMYELNEKLVKKGCDTELCIFSGGHEWPSSSLLQDAVDWIDLQAMKKGTKPQDLAFIKTQFEKYKNRAASLLKRGNLSESARYYEYAVKEFPDQVTSQKLRMTLDSLMNSRDYTKFVKESNKVRNQETDIQNMLITAFQGHIQLNSLPDSIRHWWFLQIKSLRNMEDSRDSLKREMGARLMNLFSIYCFESAKNYADIKNYKSAVNCYLIAMLIQPENKNIHYFLARVYILDNNSGNSLKSLEQAIKLGFNNRQSIEKDAAFATLRNEKKFKELMMQLK